MQILLVVIFIAFVVRVRTGEEGVDALLYGEK